MSEFHPLSGTLKYGYPSHLTIPQFLLDSSHPLRTGRAQNPWLVDDPTGRSYNLEEIRQRVWDLANGLRARFGIGTGDVVCIYSPNQIDYPIAIWAIHRLGATVSCANPSYTAGELEYQLKAVSAKLLLCHPASLQVAHAAVTAYGLPRSAIVMFSPPTPQLTDIDCVKRSPADISTEHMTTEAVIAEGKSTLRDWEEERGPQIGERIAFLSFSSGTTGLPKAIAIVHRNVIANVLQMADFCAISDPSIPWDERLFRPGDVAIGMLPLYHIYGLVVNLHFTLFAGLTLILFPKFNFPDMLKSIVRHRITTLFIVPPVVVMFTNHPDVRKYDLSHLRYCMVGAAPLSKEVTEKFKNTVPSMSIGQGYGMTETCTVVTMMPPCHQRTGAPNGSAGRLVTDTIARIVKTDGTLAGYDEPGELFVHGPQNAICYLNNEAATKETFLPGAHGWGWVRTGDEALMTREGDLYVVDRLKEILKCNGFQVAPAELEGHLVVHPFVQDAGVVGIPDDRKGEVPLAFVVLEQQVKQRVERNTQEGEAVKKTLLKHVADHKVRYKWLDGGIVFVDVVPKNPSGKILRRLLREQAKTLLQQTGKKESPPPASIETHPVVTPGGPPPVTAKL